MTHHGTIPTYSPLQGRSLDGRSLSSFSGGGFFPISRPFECSLSRFSLSPEGPDSLQRVVVPPHKDPVSWDFPLSQNRRKYRCPKQNRYRSSTTHVKVPHIFIHPRLTDFYTNKPDINYLHSIKPKRQPKPDYQGRMTLLHCNLGKIRLFVLDRDRVNVLWPSQFKVKKISYIYILFTWSETRDWVILKRPHPLKPNSSSLIFSRFHFREKTSLLLNIRTLVWYTYRGIKWKTYPTLHVKNYLSKDSRMTKSSYREWNRSR